MVMVMDKMILAMMIKVFLMIYLMLLVKAMKNLYRKVGMGM